MHRTMDGWLGLSGVGWLVSCPKPATGKPLPETNSPEDGAIRSSGDVTAFPVT